MAVAQILRAKSVRCRARWYIMQESIGNRWRILKEIWAFSVRTTATPRLAPASSEHLESWRRRSWAWICCVSLTFSIILVSLRLPFPPVPWCLSFCLFMCLAMIRRKWNCKGKAKKKKKKEGGWGRSWHLARLLFCCPTAKPGATADKNKTKQTIPWHLLG